MRLNLKEKELQKLIINWLNKHKILYYKTTGGLLRGANGTMYTSQLGWPDLQVFMENGKYYFWELKIEKGKLRDSQIQRFKQLNQAGYNVYIIRPSTWFKFLEKLDLGLNYNLAIYESFEKFKGE